MNLHEIFVNEIPLGHISYGDFVELVVKQDVRPDKPDDEDVPILTDAIWELAEKCWVKDSEKRPIASTLCDLISHLLETHANTTQSVPEHTSGLETLTELAPVTKKPIVVDEGEDTAKAKRTVPAIVSATNHKDRVCHYNYFNIINLLI